MFDIFYAGCGEHLTKTLLARECAQCLSNSDLDNSIEAVYDVFDKKFLGMLIVLLFQTLDFRPWTIKSKN